MERHSEIAKDRERMERIRAGTAAAAIMNTGMASKPDKSAFAPWDVFPDLRTDDEAAPEDDGEMKAVAAMFRGIAARQQARKATPN